MVIDLLLYLVRTFDLIYMLDFYQDITAVKHGDSVHML